MALALALMVNTAPQAQALGSLSETSNDGQHVVPVWNAHSGKVEALLLLEPDANTDRALDRVLARGTQLPGLGLGMTLNDGSRLRTSLAPEANTGLALLCSQGIHVAMTLGSLSEQCLLTNVGAGDDLALPSSRKPGLRLDNQWRSAGGGLDLNFGLSWLKAPLQGVATQEVPALPASQAVFSTLPSLVPSSLGELSLRQVHWNGVLNLPEQRWVSLGGTASTQVLESFVSAPLRWDSATLSVGVGFRGLSGRLVGRLIELSAGQGSYSGLDLGLSWRTPWQGELSIGAQNLLNQKPDTSKWPLNELPALELPSGRTPYVRYKQDL